MGKFKRTKNKVVKLAKAWIRRTGLGYWHVDLHFYKKYKYPGMASTCFEYFEADLHFGLNHLVHMSDDDLERVVIHEIAHVLTAEMNRKKVKIEEKYAAEVAKERVASQVAKALYWTKTCE